MTVVERLRWTADRLHAGGYQSLPCRRCNRQALITVHDLHQLLLDAADMLIRRDATTRPDVLVDVNGNAVVGP